MAKPLNPLIVIIGETASGKSASAMALALALKGEIVCADSWTVYKEFDIGTSKPTVAERAQVPHHLLDIASAKRGFNVAIFKDLADTVIEDIGTRGKLPILVGGSGLYVDSILYNYSFLPTAKDQERDYRNQQELSELLSEAKEKGIDLEGIDIRNKRRVIRALETDGQRPVTHSLRPNTLMLGIKIDRDTLLKQVTERVDTMFANGLEQEVERLKQLYGWSVEPMKGIGYREWREYFDGSQNLEQTKERIIRSTMNLAKKQRTWFKRNKSTHWIDDPSNIVDLATTFLNKNR